MAYCGACGAHVEGTFCGMCGARQGQPGSIDLGREPGGYAADPPAVRASDPSATATMAVQPSAAPWQDPTGDDSSQATTITGYPGVNRGGLTHPAAAGVKARSGTTTSVRTVAGLISWFVLLPAFALTSLMFDLIVLGALVVALIGFVGAAWLVRARPVLAVVGVFLAAVSSMALFYGAQSAEWLAAYGLGGEAGDVDPMAVGLPVGAGLMVLSWIVLRGASPLTTVVVVPAIVFGALPRLVSGPGYGAYTVSGMVLWVLAITAVAAVLAIAVEVWIALRARSRDEGDRDALVAGEPRTDEAGRALPSGEVNSGGSDWIFDPEQR